MSLQIMRSSLFKYKNNDIKSSFRFKASLLTLAILQLLLIHGTCLTCSSSISIANPIKSDQYSFPGYAGTTTYAVTLGPISSSLYFLYSIYTPYYGVIRKVNPNGTEAWTFVVSFDPAVKSLSIDPNEQHVYTLTSSGQMNACKFEASTGNLLEAVTL